MARVFLESGRISRCRAWTPSCVGAQPWPTGSSLCRAGSEHGPSVMGAQRWPRDISLYRAGSAEHGPPVVAGLSGGPRGLPCIRQDLWLQARILVVAGEAGLACRVFLVPGRSCRARDPQSSRGSRWPAGSQCLGVSTYSMWDPPGPACSPAAPQHVGFPPPAHDRASSPALQAGSHPPGPPGRSPSSVR